MSWQDDDTIRSGLAGADLPAWLAAAEAMILRAGAHDRPGDIEPVPLATLARLARGSTYDDAKQLVSFLLELDGHEGALDRPVADVLAALVASDLPFETMHAVAMELKIQATPGDRVRQVVQALGLLTPTMSRARRPACEHFLDCLLDGSEAVREATDAALAGWTDAEVRAALRSSLGLALQPAPAASDLIYTRGREHAPDSPFGLETLTVTADTVRYERRHLGRTDTSNAAISSRQWVDEALESASFPSVPPHGIPPGSGLVTLTLEGDTATMDYFTARTFEGYGPLVKRFETWLIFFRKHLTGEDVSTPEGLSLL